MNEFKLIDQFFSSIPLKRKEVVLGIGDDAACLRIPHECDLLVSTDTLVSDVHFLPSWNPFDIAYKAVMCNVSDIAAMGAEPCYLTLAVTLPKADEAWLQAFADGLQAAMAVYNLDLIGGDTTHGPLSLTITIMGLSPQGTAVTRSGAKAGDVIFVTGELGAAALAVSLLKNNNVADADRKVLMDKLLHPMPRVDFAGILREFASAAIDISDGLSADLNHICEASLVGACLEHANIPVHHLLAQYSGDHAVDLALTGGDDYELCFTVPHAKVNAFQESVGKAGLSVYAIGHMENELGLRILSADGAVEEYIPKGYKHF